MTPLEAFATAVAFMVDADKKRPAEEKASILSLFGKHVTNEDLSAVELEKMSKQAFDYVNRYSIEHFLDECAGSLTNMQKMAIYANIFEIMLVDGTLVSSEQAVLRRIEEAFQIDREIALAVREVIIVKNDTRMFIHADHPRNEFDAQLPVRFVRGEPE